MPRWKRERIQIFNVWPVWVPNDFSVLPASCPGDIIVAFACFYSLRQLQKRVFAFPSHDNVQLWAFLKGFVIPERNVRSSSNRHAFGTSLLYSLDQFHRSIVR
jgi:hypothetical protein